MKLYVGLFLSLFSISLFAMEPSQKWTDSLDAQLKEIVEQIQRSNTIKNSLEFIKSAQLNKLNCAVIRPALRDIIYERMQYIHINPAIDKSILLSTLIDFPESVERYEIALAQNLYDRIPSERNSETLRLLEYFYKEKKKIIESLTTDGTFLNLLPQDLKNELKNYWKVELQKRVRKVHTCTIV